MWHKGWREQVWHDLAPQWDILIIGGGITAAGILRRAVQEGYRALLVEAADFASGTSSKSSKLIHGGFRYLRNKQFKVTRESVREREWLLKEARHLVTPLGFIMPCPDDLHIARQYGIGVVIYDLLAPKWQHSKLSRDQILNCCPELRSGHLGSGYLYFDAAMDDARLVFRLIREAVAGGGTALNYTRASQLLKNAQGEVCGAVLFDRSPYGLGEKEVTARVVINATGPWSDELRAEVGAPARIRKLRGSHLVFSRERLPLQRAVSLMHPRDHRAMFAIPWEGVSLIGTTDLDHTFPLADCEPFCTAAEINYILEAANYTFPSLELAQSDVVSTFSGLRPIINTGQADPSKESRAHVVWQEHGLITITGGKYTTFRIMTEQALQMAAPRLPHPADLSARKKYFDPHPRERASIELPEETYSYLIGRYGHETAALLAAAGVDENEPIHNLTNLWSELRWAARTGAVEHLDDLLLRRIRLGMLLPDAARADLDRIGDIVRSELDWDAQRWQAEVARYLEIYQKAYSPAPAGC